MEQQPAGDRCGRMQRNVFIVESRRNGPQPSMRHDDDDDDGHVATLPMAIPEAEISAVRYFAVCVAERCILQQK